MLQYGCKDLGLCWKIKIINKNNNNSKNKKIISSSQLCSQSIPCTKIHTYVREHQQKTFVMLSRFWLGEEDGGGGGWRGGVSECVKKGEIYDDFFR